MGHGPCPCKFRLSISGQSTPATVTVTEPNGNETTFTGRINFSAEQCFTGAPKCNPAVNNFTITFEDNGNTINFTQGKRGTIACIDNAVATLIDGTAQASGNVLDGKFTVDFSYSINPLTNVASIVITATGEDNTVFQTTFTAPVSLQTFVGDCACPPGPAGPSTLLTTYGDAGGPSIINPSSKIAIPLIVMYVSSNTTLTDKGIIVPTKGVYEIEFTANATLKPQSRLILDFMVNGAFIARRSSTRSFNPTSNETDICMGRSILYELAAGDEVSIGILFAKGNMVIIEPNLKIIKIDNS
ncbi:hypothetical protein [Priestia megaterium]|uniref:hypothetical protein n=1 Tax=Priestia megaterium TaxID=1404 RepID=UPI00221EB702|nr:hypothetical protein [Priestia megaterium]UYV55642.1 hypothetical protein OHU65_26885 [Priestia megaterium]